MKLNEAPCKDDKARRLKETLLSLYKILQKIEAGHHPIGEFTHTLRDDLPARSRFNVQRYPKLLMTFSEGDMAAIQKCESHDAKGLAALATTPLEKLAIATLWKNGDLQKLRHIAAGVLDVSPALASTSLAHDKAAVFRQFGRHLAQPRYQPIADQHTVRAHRCHCSELEIDLRERDDGTVRPGDVDAYVGWVTALITGRAPDEAVDAYGFDIAMFELGSATKAFVRSMQGKKAKLTIGR